MTLPYHPLLLPLCAFLFTVAGTGLALACLGKRMLDRPSARSNHSVPTLRGGGIAMILALLIFLMGTGLDPCVILAALLLACVSFADDMRPLPPLLRLLAQVFAVGLALHAIPGRIFPPFIPHAAECVILAFLWIWFINLTNFMDGIDGITCAEMIALGLGLCALHILRHAIPETLALQGSVLAAAAFGFYVFNRSPAKLFMGDVGSIPLGFISGFLLLSLAAHGAWAAALILPGYYLTDATFTLVRRLSRSEPIWEAHSDHAYQVAVRAGLSHASVVSQVALLNAALAALALLSLRSPATALAAFAAAYLLSACLMHRFHALSSR